ncbi:MAG: HU family DNA-binding protein, partial [Blastocatellia bacterium]
EIPGKRFLAKRLAHNFNEQVAKPGQEITEEQANKALGILVDLFGSAIVTEGGFELRGFAAMQVKKSEPQMKRNPRTGEVIRDEEGNPVYYSRRRVAVSVSSVILDSLNT